MEVAKILFNGTEYQALYRGDELIYSISSTPSVNGYLNVQNDGMRFDFDYTPNKDTVIKLKIRPLDGRDDVWYAVLWSGTGDNFRGWGIRTRGGDELRVGNWDKENVVYNLKFLNDTYDITMGSGYCYIDGLKDSASAVWSPNYTYLSYARPFVLGSWSKAGVNRPILGYYGRFSIYENDVLVRDYIPTLDNDGKPCYYDAVLKNYFYPQTREGTIITYGIWED